MTTIDVTRRGHRDAELLLVGNPERVHMGSHLAHAADELGLRWAILDVRLAFDGPKLARVAAWRLAGGRPLRLGRFLREAGRALASPPRWLLAVGISPLNREILSSAGRLGVRRLCYLTDDPWNPAHRAQRFLATLPEYDQVFSPRRANLADLERAGCSKVAYLPFGYAPDLHFPASRTTDAEASPDCDVLFVGGADPDRLPWVTALLDAGLTVGLYGGYWHRHQVTRPHARGLLPPEDVRRAVATARVCLCLVRRANRDDHAMRSYELPAMGACIIAEDTDAHRALYGAEGEGALYFTTPTELVAKTRWLLAHEEARARLAAVARSRITSAPNTYTDRLAAMLDAVGGRTAGP